MGDGRRETEDGGRRSIGTRPGDWVSNANDALDDGLRRPEVKWSMATPRSGAASTQRYSRSTPL